MVRLWEGYAVYVCVCGRESLGFFPGWLSSYLIVDSIVEAATFLDGHAGFAIVQEARVTFTALSTSTWALQGSAECRAAQGTGVSTEFIVAV
jgi:hypothetical protein